MAIMGLVCRPSLTGAAGDQDILRLVHLRHVGSGHLLPRERVGKLSAVGRGVARALFQSSGSSSSRWGWQQNEAGVHQEPNAFDAAIRVPAAASAAAGKIAATGHSAMNRGR